MEESVIVSNPEVMRGKPVIRGTRITVEHLLEELAADLSVEELLAAHPHITRAQIQAALAFAAEAVKMERLYLIEQAAP